MALAADSSDLRNRLQYSGGAYGRNILSSFPLPELGAAAARSEHPAWHIDEQPEIPIPPGLHWTALWRGNDQAPWTLSAVTGDACYLRFSKFADFLVRPPHITVAVRGFTRAHTVRHLLLDQVMPLGLATEGRIVLHAAALREATGETLLLCGPGGAGKSTLAAALARAGLRVLADDSALLEWTDKERPAVIASYPGLRIWDDVALAAGYTLGAGREVAEYTRKQRVAVDTSVDTSAAPLGAIYVVRPAAALGFTRLAGAAAIRALLEHTFRCTVTRRDLPAGLDAAARLASVAAIWSIDVPRGLDRIDAVASALITHAAEQGRVHAAVSREGDKLSR